MKRVMLAIAVCLCVGAAAPNAWATTKFHPRVGGALGLVPPVDGSFSPDIASGALVPVTYHGGQVMTGGVTVHTIWWAPSGYAFSGSPATGVPDYKGTIEKFLTDVAADSGTATNVYSVLTQFAQGLTPTTITPGDYAVHYSAATDSINDTDPYPSKAVQCASPQSVSTCITDGQVQAEVDHIIAATHGSRGLHDIWYVFTPPNVDECIDPGVCESDAYGGYHSLSDVGHNVAIYAYTGDPSVETRRVYNQGDDPQGNPDAELVADIVAHETVEAMTDPEGVGYMDPNGYETGDKCEFGPQYGQPLGFAANGSPYNQVINGDKWLIQEMWANHDNNGDPDCVQSTTDTHNDLPLPQVSMTQFDPTVTGNTENGAGDGVTVKLMRMGADGNPVEVSSATTTAAGDGSWSVTLSHPVGDDRDEIDISYSGTNAPPSDVIMTGDGGNPFTESGWTGWTALDQGTTVSNSPSPALTEFPCFQTGVLTASRNGTAITGPSGEPTLTSFCNTQTDAATEPLATPVGPGDVITVSSMDNRGFMDPNGPGTPDGGPPNSVGSLDTLTITAPEAGATGFPTCTADLEAQSVGCTGLVPGQQYTVTDGSQSQQSTADGGGSLSVSLSPLKGGDTVALSNGSRNVTTLHVANLRATVTNVETILSGGSCSGDQYFEAPLSSPPTSAAAGLPSAFVGGSDLTGAICPSSGDATGFASAAPIIQTDEGSGGATQTEIPDLVSTSPMEGETVYGAFTALAESGLPGPFGSVTPLDSTSTIGFSMTPAGGSTPVFTASNVDTPSGTAVPAQTPGSYQATWTLSGPNGDTRVVTTRFIEEPANQGPKGDPGPQGPKGDPGPPGPKPHIRCKLVSKKHHHRSIKCKVTYHKNGRAKDHVALRVQRGSRIMALGQAALHRGSASLTMRMIRTRARGAWSVTVVLQRARGAATTTTSRIRMG